MLKAARPDLCLYHANCTDGFGAALAVWMRFGNTVRYHPVSYDDATTPDVVDQHVVIVDFCYPEATLRGMAVLAASITVIDHHKTAIENLAEVAQAGLTWDDHVPVGLTKRFDLDRSGAVLTWDFFHAPKPAPRMFLHIQDRDLWKHHLEGSHEVHAYLGSLPWDFAQWEQASWALERGDQQYRIGAAILRRHKRDLEDMLALTRRTMRIGGVVVPVANVPHQFASEAGDIMGQDAPFAATYFDKSDVRRFSLRSRGPDGADVSKIARLYGGGGHRNAAGFSVSIGWEGDPDIGSVVSFDEGKAIMRRMIDTAQAGDMLATLHTNATGRCTSTIMGGDALYQAGFALVVLRDLAAKIAEAPPDRQNIDLDALHQQVTLAVAALTAAGGVTMGTNVSSRRTVAPAGNAEDAA